MQLQGYLIGYKVEVNYPVKTLSGKIQNFIWKTIEITIDPQSKEEEKMLILATERTILTLNKTSDVLISEKYDGKHTIGELFGIGEYI